MRFDVYGRFQLEVIREGERWVVYRPGLGTREKVSIVVPPTFEAEEIATYLDDLFHEAGKPGEVVRRIE